MILTNQKNKVNYGSNMKDDKYNYLNDIISCMYNINNKSQFKNFKLLMLLFKTKIQTIQQ